MQTGVVEDVEVLIEIALKAEVAVSVGQGLEQRLVLYVQLLPACVALRGHQVIAFWRGYLIVIVGLWRLVVVIINVVAAYYDDAVFTIETVVGHHTHSIIVFCLGVVIEAGRQLHIVAEVAVAVSVGSHVSHANNLGLYGFGYHRYGLGIGQPCITGFYAYHVARFVFGYYAIFAFAQAFYLLLYTV